MNFAGVMATEKYTKSADGYELQFAASHLGHFLLTNLLMNKITAGGPGVGIVNLTSMGYEGSDIRDDWNFSASIAVTLLIRHMPWTGRQTI